jgi:hypothetical protein
MMSVEGSGGGFGPFGCVLDDVSVRTIVSFRLMRQLTRNAA